MSLNNELMSFAERYVRLEEASDEISSDKKDLKAEIKSAGFDEKLVVQTAKIMRMDAGKKKEALDRHDMFTTYLARVGLTKDVE